MTFKCTLTITLLSLAVFPSFAQTKSLPDINEKALLNDFKVLASDDMEGREPGHPGHDKALAYIAKRFKEVGLTAFNDSYFQKFEFFYPRDSAHKFNGTNVIGYVKGKSNPEKYIAVTAHYDHLGKKGDKIFNGADDNASGTASLLSMADYFNEHKPGHSLLFVAVDAEERSGAGARQFVNHPPLDIRQIIMNVNNDMIARDTADVLFAVGTYHYPYLKAILEPAVAKVPVKIVYGHDKPGDGNIEDWTGSSDHHAFHQSKIPFIYFGVEDAKYHHDEADEYQNMTLPFYVKAVQSIIICVQEFDKRLDDIDRLSQTDRKR